MVTVSMWRSLMRTPVRLVFAMVLLLLSINCFVCLPAERSIGSVRGVSAGRGIPDRREDMPRKPGTAAPGASYGRPDGKVKQAKRHRAHRSVRDSEAETTTAAAVER